MSRPESAWPDQPDNQRWAAATPGAERRWS